MARKRKKNQTATLEINNEKIAQSLADLMNKKIEEEYGDYIDPDHYIIPFGIKPLDVILGGGLVTGLPAMITGPAEMGKTTIAWQLIKSLQENYENSIALYIDVEGSAHHKNKYGISSRAELMNIDMSTVIYKSMVLSLEKVFSLIKDCVHIKQQLEKQLQLEKQIPMVVVWDSIADTEPEKIEKADDPNSIIGYKSRAIQFWLGREKPLFRLNQVLLFMIDQVRSNISNNMMYQKKEKTVNVLNDLKSATGSRAVEHKLRQWIFISKESDIYDLPDIQGWYLNIYIAKCKLAPSGFSIKAVFDKRYGLHKFWTEFTFISEYAPFEKKIISKNNKYKDTLPEFSAKLSGSRYTLFYIDEETGEVIQYKKSFYKSEALDLYNNDPEFKEIFDKAVDYQIRKRIIEKFSNKEIIEELKEEMNLPEDDNEEQITIDNSNINQDLPISIDTSDLSL